MSAVRSLVVRLRAPLRRGQLGASLNRSLLVVQHTDALAGHAGDLVYLVAGAGPLTVLVESAPQLPAPGCRPVLLGPLGADDAAVLFRRSAEPLGMNPGEDATTPARVARICAAVDGNPLAVELAATRLPSLPLASLEVVLSSPLQALQDRALYRR